MRKRRKTKRMRITKGGRPGFYPWDDWLTPNKRGLRRHLKFGVHYRVPQSSMVAQIRNEAVRRGLFVEIEDRFDKIILLVKGVSSQNGRKKPSTWPPCQVCGRKIRKPLPAGWYGCRTCNESWKDMGRPEGKPKDAK